MKLRFAGLVALAIAVAPAAFAQATYQPPRTPDGKPDFNGFWTNVSLTSLERSGQFKSLAIPEADAQRIEAGRAAADVRASLPTDPNSGAPKAGQDVGGYNNFYVDAGTQFAKINGEIRSSWIVDPPSGRIPYTADGKKKFDESLHFVRNTFDGPETRPMAERCLVGFGSTGGPPMINVMYNNTYQFLQTGEHVVIVVEMNHDARIIPLKTTDQKNPQWLGNSKGRWEGDTLVVETTNFNPGESLRTFFQNSYLLSPDAKVIERFSRIGDTQILYQFSVDDPKLFSQVWKAEMIFNQSKQPAYEYACHEGNYALPGILAGARKNEKLGLANYAEEGE
ncbi:MAG TPA: hypothetical protein PLH23_02915 [Hyphomonadaceae bacterium]|nr:hypothetical protein [Hyphomonadaceae bacterium]HPI47190.1 hypothetical protein [Hyphomonadaceae bacterium]